MAFDQIQFQLEMLAFEEKIALSKLEFKKAEERAFQLEYEKARFHLDWTRNFLREEEKRLREQIPNSAGQGTAATGTAAV